METGKGCEYCNGNDMESALIQNQTDSAHDIIIDGEFMYVYCQCGAHPVTKINYCPMCGKKL